MVIPTADSELSGVLVGGPTLCRSREALSCWQLLACPVNLHTPQLIQGKVQFMCQE